MSGKGNCQNPHVTKVSQPIILVFLQSVATGLGFQRTDIDGDQKEAPEFPCGRYCGWKKSCTSW